MLRSYIRLATRSFFIPSFPIPIMAIQAQDLTYDDLVKVVEPLVCKALTSPVVNSLPAGIFDPVTLPLKEMSASDNPSVHLFDAITSYRPSIDFRDLDSKYKQAIINNDLDLLPEPFRSKVQLPKDTKLQIFIFPCSNGAHYIVKHYISGTKCKPNVFMDAVYGKAHIYRWLATNPILGKKILLHTLENMGGHQMKVFDLHPGSGVDELEMLTRGMLAHIRAANITDMSHL